MHSCFSFLSSNLSSNSFVLSSLYILSRYLRAVRLPHQNSANARKFGRRYLPVNARLVKANNHFGMNKIPNGY
ncbi:hypothetical protein COF80_10690 [Bacillus toyonensis]|nr:hypothetical protein [Bacillus toyonensis]OTW74766.1 hypothetical protein BK702_32395 [Bacillus thuringiensis serovar cameroun]OTX08578.1 hypothetical protein BK712_12505 [Bacillus thuringiensis serovar seoulensis]PEK56405.1 hypothetical protein CN586_00710 [Bacillus toyonensis]PEM43400.1 hypothetical protein CN636_16530 [Bacillus toyonensis]